MPDYRAEDAMHGLVDMMDDVFLVMQFGDGVSAEDGAKAYDAAVADLESDGQG